MAPASRSARSAAEGQSRSHAAVAPRRARGLTLVELLVGLAIGLFLVAVGITLLTGNLRENRALLVESRLMQDLRTAGDVVSRDLRRAGYWGDAGAGIQQRGTDGVSANPYTALSPAAAASDAVSFRFARDATKNTTVDSNEQFGFRLRNGTLEMMLGSGNWQAVTDASTLVVDRFSVTPSVQDIALDAFCGTPCAAGSSSCPHQQVRSLSVALTAHATSDARVVRSLEQTVRLRNDLLSGECPT